MTQEPRRPREPASLRIAGAIGGAPHLPRIWYYRTRTAMLLRKEAGLERRQSPGRSR